MLGLLAFARDQPAQAAELLAAPGLEWADDWRLQALAEASAANQALPAARRALEELLGRHPASPLRPAALERAVELAAQAGDAAGATRWIEASRRETLPPEIVEAIERRAWQLGRDRNDVALASSAARRLLVEAPLEASRLKVVEHASTRRELGADWRLWLGPAELVRRAEALLAVELPAGALTTLDAVPAAARDFPWRMVEARALTESGRGAEAWARLGSVTTSDPARNAELIWRRALAAEAAAGARTTPPTEVANYRRLAREQLLRVARGSDGEASGSAPGHGSLAPLALRKLAASYLEEERLAEALAALRQLAQLDPDDSSPARIIWEHGWAAYERGDSVRAVALWRDLIAIYPRSGSSRSARYWSARALDRTGQPGAAKSLYLELVARGMTDFYARQAALRLAGATTPPPAAPAERDDWPEHPALARAVVLAELALEPLARRELELLAPAAEPRAAAALEATVLASAGDRRASLTALRRAFPALGTAHQEHVPERALALFYPTDYSAQVQRAAKREGLPAPLVMGIVHQESAFDAAARSRSGARGLMQLMPTTGKEVAAKLGLPFSQAKLNDPEYSLALGTRYFKQQLDRFDGNVELALAGYNGGPGRISRLWRAAGPNVELDRFLESLAITESRNYVKRILVLSESYRSRYPELG